MEIIDNNHTPDNRRNDRNDNRLMSETQSRNLFIGILLIAAGGLWLLRNFNLMPWRIFDTIFSWQMLLLVIGMYLLTLRRWIGGGIITAVGFVLLIINIMGIYISFSKVIFPLVLIAAGAAIILSINKKK